MAISVISLLFFTGCVEEALEDLAGDSGGSTTEYNDNLKIEKNFPNNFKITLNSENGTYLGYEVRKCTDSSCDDDSYFGFNEVGANYQGTVVTDCQLVSMSGDNVDNFSCTTTWNTSAPFGDPEPQTQSIQMVKGSKYMLDVIIPDPEYGTNAYENITVETFNYTY